MQKKPTKLKPVLYFVTLLDECQGTTICIINNYTFSFLKSQIKMNKVKYIFVHNSLTPNNTVFTDRITIA